MARPRPLRLLYGMVVGRGVEVGADVAGTLEEEESCRDLSAEVTDGLTTDAAAAAADFRGL